MSPFRLNSFRNFSVYTVMIFLCLNLSFGCRQVQQIVPLVTKATLRIISKNSKSFPVVAEIKVLINKKPEVAKLFSASLEGVSNHTMEELEMGFKKAANKDFLKYYKGFLVFLGLGETAKISAKSFEDYVKSLPNKEQGISSNGDSSIFTFPVTHSVDGRPFTVDASVNLTHFFENQSSVNVNQIEYFEFESEVIELEKFPMPAKAIHTEIEEESKREVKPVVKTPMEIMLNEFLQKYQGQTIRHEWGIEVRIDNVPIKAVLFKKGKPWKINVDPEKGGSEFDYDYIDEDGDGSPKRI